MLEGKPAALLGHAPTSQAEPKPHAINRKIVQRADQEKHPGEQQQFSL